MLLATKPPAPPTRRRRRLGANVFTDKTSLKAAITAFNNDETTATATYGPVADWDVSKITDMSYLFNGLTNFNADISNWNTSSVTNMYAMFYVRFRLRLLPSLPSRATHARRVRC